MAKKTLRYSADNINRLLEKIDQLDLSDVTGKVPNLFIGTVTTLPSGSNATATITPNGTDSYVINLGIPKGDNGEAPTIRVGTITQGSTANVVIREVSGELLFDFTLPKGDKGDTGAKGDKGDKGDTPTIKVGTVTQGTANVAIREVNGEYLFDFTLPNGSGGGIIPTIKVSDNTYSEVKTRLTNSAIISIPPTSKTLATLDTTIKYLKQKGYTFLTLADLLTEDLEK